MIVVWSYEKDVMVKLQYEINSENNLKSNVVLQYHYGCGWSVMCGGVQDVTT